MPQKYLRGFSIPSNDALIWVYDKRDKCFFANPVSIKKVAQERKYYNDDDEKKLNILVEIPASKVLDQLRSRNFNITDSDRLALSVYMAVMIKRVPRFRQRGYDLLPNVIKKTFDGLYCEIEKLAYGKISSDKYSEYLSNAKKVEAEYSKELPEHVQAKINDLLRTPWPSKEVIGNLYNMQWRFILSDGPSYFVASDDPLFYWDKYGIANDESEMLFPISKDVLLWGSWYPINYRYIFKDQVLIHEANKRVTNKAMRFIYSHDNADWIMKTANRQTPRFKMIRWSNYK